VARPPNGVTYAIHDMPAGLSGKALKSIVKVSSSINVPVRPSPFDLWTTKQFLEQLAELRAVTRGKAGVALIDMRVAPRTLAAIKLNEFLAHQGFHTLTIIRPTQLYPRVAALGAAIFDVALSLAEHELEDWQPLIECVDVA
jgi:chromosome partitioning protein